jgi:hypothetical protein
MYVEFFSDSSQVARGFQASFFSYNTGESTPEPEETTNEVTETFTDYPVDTTPEPTVCIEGGIYMLPVKGNCSAYIQCINHFAIPRVCAEGLLFDPVFRKCNVPDLVTCEDDHETTLAPSEPTPAIPSCGGDIWSDYGTISSPNYPANYDNNLYCVWRIYSSSSTPFYVTFHPITLPTSNCATCDWIEVRDGPYANSHLLAKFTSRNSYYNYFATTSSVLYVMFRTDGSGVASGFTASYEPIDIGSTNPPVETTPEDIISTQPPSPYCSQDFYDDFGYFSTPYYPSNYPDFSDCIWRFNVLHDRVVHIDFHGIIDIEPHPNCDYDYLEIRDGPNSYSPLLARICGNQGSLPSITSTSNTLWAHFHSDHGATHQGFLATYTSVIGSDPTANPGTTTTTTFKPNLNSTTTPIVGPGIVINNNNNMFVNFFDWAKLGSWLSELKAVLGNSSALN